MLVVWEETEGLGVDKRIQLDVGSGHGFEASAHKFFLHLVLQGSNFLVGPWIDPLEIVTTSVILAQGFQLTHTFTSLFAATMPLSRHINPSH